MCWKNRVHAAAPLCQEKTKTVQIAPTFSWISELLEITLYCLPIISSTKLILTWFMRMCECTHMYMHVTCICASLGIENFGDMKILISKWLLHTCQILFGVCSCSARSYWNVKRVLAAPWPGITFGLRVSVGISDTGIRAQFWNNNQVQCYQAEKWNETLCYRKTRSSWW